MVLYDISVETTKGAPPRHDSAKDVDVAAVSLQRPFDFFGVEKEHLEQMIRISAADGYFLRWLLWMQVRNNCSRPTLRTEILSARQRA